MLLTTRGEDRVRKGADYERRDRLMAAMEEVGGEGLLTTRGEKGC